MREAGLLHEREGRQEPGSVVMHANYIVTTLGFAMVINRCIPTPVVNMYEEICAYGGKDLWHLMIEYIAVMHVSKRDLIFCYQTCF